MKKAFTLGEILITLAIIGVIAVITIPTLYSNYTDQERISRAKKGYATLANAMTMVKTWGGDYIFDVRDGSNENMEEWYNEYLKPNLQIIKTCYNKAGCWNEENTKNLSGVNAAYNRKGIGIGSNIITAVMNDGTMINIDAYSSNDIWRYFGVDLDTVSGVVVFFDINGVKKPNTIGKDIFITVFTEDGLVPAYRDMSANKVLSDCSSKGTGYSCLRIYLKK